VEHSAPLQHQTIESLEDVFGAKVRGSWVLAQECGSEVEQLVLFSSAAALFGPPFLCGYAAANAFLDALALNYRPRRDGTSRGHRDLRVLSINWGRWGEVGMAARAEARTGYASMLTGAMSPEAAVAALERALMSDVAQTAVVPIDWSAWRSHDRFASLPFFSLLAGATSAAADARRHSVDLPQANGESGGEGRRLFAYVERVMELAPGALDPDAPLVALGLDSLMAVELRASIEASYGVNLALEHILGGASARDLLGGLKTESMIGTTPQPAIVCEEGEL
jgi:acyl carrier protein